SQDIKKIISKLPDTPGVYFFVRKMKKNDGVEYKKILYIGKATSLRDRVRSYFNKDIVNTRSPLVFKMLEEFTDVEFTSTDSVLEALVLEAYLIKKHQPDANIKEKDNRSFNFVVITKEDFPRVCVVRSRELLHSSLLVEGLPIDYSFGPFPNGSQLKEALKIIRKMFPYRDSKCAPNQGRPCFNRQIGLCPGVCTGEVTKEEYEKTIKNIILFFEGDKKRLAKNLEKQMGDYAKDKHFEKAEKIKRTIFTLNHIQDISLIKDEIFTTGNPGQTTMRIESYDIAHMSGQNVVGVMTVVEDGEIKKSDYRKFKIRGTGEVFSKVLGKNPQTIRKNSSGTDDSRFINDTKALKEVLARRLAHIEWRFPDLIVVDGGVAQKNAISKILKENNQDIPVVSVVKDERHKPKEILGDKRWLKYEKEILISNAEAHRYAIGFHKQLRGKIR
ncbi:MAG: GIY-YIG nuclease family protein, partial [Parcubacteria group bacterium]